MVWTSASLLEHSRSISLSRAVNGLDSLDVVRASVVGFQDLCHTDVLPKPVLHEPCHNGIVLFQVFQKVLSLLNCRFLAGGGQVSGASDPLMTSS